MLTVISPAKKLNETPRALPDGIEMTEPAFASDAMELVHVARQLSVTELQKLSGISESLGKLNQDRFATFSAQPAPGTVFPAMHCFAGDTYQGLDARSLSLAAQHHAVGHLRILSGLYGLLRPFDGIQAYRLEMGSKLGNSRGKDLYAYWGPRLGQALQELAQEKDAAVVVNCASVEYFGAVDTDALGLPVIMPMFYEEKEDAMKIVSFHAKRARGMMARFICENQLHKPEDLRAFDLGGYQYRAELSGTQKMVFTRSEAAQVAA